MRFYKLSFRFFYFNSITRILTHVALIPTYICPNLTPIPRIPTQFPAIPPFAPRFPTLPPLFPAFPPPFPAFHSFRSPILHSGFYKYPNLPDSVFRNFENCKYLKFKQGVRKANNINMLINFTVFFWNFKAYNFRIA